MVDSITETTSESWLDRIGGAIKGVAIGFILVIASIVVLFWNEGNAVRTAKALAEGLGAVVQLQAPKLEAGHDKQLIHFTGDAKGQVLSDSEFGVSEDAIKLRRVVSMYQWKETEKSEKRPKLGGGEETVTTYTYAKDWSETPIDSSKFHGKAAIENQNPPFAINKWDTTASPVRVGDFTLSAGLVSQISNWTPRPVKEGPETVHPADPRIHIYNGEFYRTFNAPTVSLTVPAPAATTPAATTSAPAVAALQPAPFVPGTPVLGDMKIRFEVVKPGPVSVIAQQMGSSLVPYPTQQPGKLLEILHTGIHSAPEMFATEQAKANMLTWILRLVGFIVMWIALAMILNPLKVVADVLPFLGSLIGAGIGMITGIIALLLSLLTIAVGWLFYRPALGVGLIAVVVALIVLVGKMRRKPAAAPALVPPAPPPTA